MASKKGVKQKKNFLIRNLHQSLEYIKINKKSIYFAIYLFLAFILIAILFPTPNVIVEKINELIKSLAEKTEGLGVLGLIYFIFKNNLTVSFIGLIFGIIFSIVPLIFIAANGYVLGYVIKLVVGKLGFVSGILGLWKLFPHGIFELPAVIISLGLGIKLGEIMIMSLNENSFKNLKHNLISALRVLLFIVLPLLVIAAIIEGSLIIILG